MDKHSFINEEVEKLITQNYPKQYSKRKITLSKCALVDIALYFFILGEKQNDTQNGKSERD